MFEIVINFIIFFIIILIVTMKMSPFWCLCCNFNCNLKIMIMYVFFSPLFPSSLPFLPQSNSSTSNKTTTTTTTTIIINNRTGFLSLVASNSVYSKKLTLRPTCTLLFLSPPPCPSLSLSLYLPLTPLSPGPTILSKFISLFLPLINIEIWT